MDDILALLVFTIHHAGDGRAKTLFDRLHMIYRCWRYRFKSEVPSIRYVRNSDLRGKTILDIGANKGIYTIYLSRAAGPQGRVIAFEAQPELGAHLQWVRDAFGLTNADIENTGLSSSVGTLTMYRTASGSGGASFDFYDGNEQGIERLEIPVTTLDDYFDEHPCARVSLIKCDVEGHEASVLMGGRRLLSRDMPALLFECHERDANEGELFSFLDDLGYDGYFFHVTPEDHASLFRKGRGRYVHYKEHRNYDYCRSGVRHRNYVFVPRGETPDAYPGAPA